MQAIRRRLAGALLVGALVLVPAGGAVPQTPTPPPPSTAGVVREPDPVAAVALLQDLESGQTLFEKASNEARPVASLTKIMTALLVLERVPLDDEVIVSAAAVAQPGSEPLLTLGDRLSVLDLLYAMLLPSSNDAAVALAEHVAGTESAFVALMNLRAEELGLRDTFLFSASGFDDRGLSSAADIAELTRAAMRFPRFAGIVRTKEHRIVSASGSGERVQNRNLLLSVYPGAIGVKTGLTGAAGHCLVAVAERGRERLIAVVLGHPDVSFGDGAALLDFGFRGFDRTMLLRAGETVGRVVIDGRQVDAVARRDLSGLVRIAPPGHISTRFRPRSGLALPLRRGAPLGRVNVLIDGRRVATVAAVAASPVPAEPVPPGGDPRPTGSGGPGPSGRVRPSPSPEEIVRVTGLVVAIVREVASVFL